MPKKMISEIMLDSQQRFKTDLFDVLDQSPEVVPDLLRRVNSGLISGLTYICNGDCGCLLGSIEIIKGYRSEEEMLHDLLHRQWRDIEGWVSHDRHWWNSGG